MARLLQVYEGVLVPFGNGRRYDLVVDTGEEFLRIQCKTGRLRKGAIIFNANSQDSRNPRGRGISYRGQVEMFGIWCPDNDKVYLVPVADVGELRGWLRIEPTKNGQSKNIRMAQQYELAPTSRRSLEG
jgi:PD-(D/E)XK endonuclease